MLCLRFSIDSNLYGFEIDRAVEIVPWVPLRKIHGAPDYVPGNFNYRNHVVPVIDLTMLTVKKPSRQLLSSRIAVVRYAESRLLGLIMENATEIMEINTDEKALQPSGIETNLPYMGKISTENKEMLQLVNIEKLLDEKIRKIIFPENKAAADD